MKYILIALGTIFIIAFALFIIAFSFVLSSLIFWGLGNLIIWIFKINYTWTFLHGLACALVFELLKDIFSRK